MTRFVDRGAITAAYVGIGVAVTIAVSFLLIIPIEPVIWLLTVPSGLLIGYYANQRSDRRAGPWRRILRNALFAAFVTGADVRAAPAAAQVDLLLRRQRATRTSIALTRPARRSRRPARPARIVSIRAISRSTEGPNSKRLA